MFDTKKALTKFKILDPKKKQDKLKSVLKLMSKTSGFRGDLRTKFQEKAFTDNNVLDYLYELVMRLVSTNQDKKRQHNIKEAQTISLKLSKIKEKENKENKDLHNNIDNLLN